MRDHNQFANYSSIVNVKLIPLSHLYYKVVGWDVEWNVNWGAGSLRESANEIMRKVNSVTPKEANKVVILTHDVGLRSDNAQKELGKFIEMGKKAGYKFRTLDTYTQD